MYCSSCGASITPGLSYCNRCGANLKPSESVVPSSKPAGLAWIVWFGILMMGTPFPAMIIVFESVRVLKQAGFPIEYAMALAVFSLLMVFGSVVLLSRLLSPMVRAYLRSGEPVKSKTPELSGPTRAQIEAVREPVSSVTENTTRSFEPAYREQ
jgi:hypothetical protein